MKGKEKLTWLASFVFLLMLALSFTTVNAVEDNTVDDMAVEETVMETTTVENTVTNETEDVTLATEETKDGWYEENGSIYYYEDGVMLTSSFVDVDYNSITDTYGYFYVDENGKMIQSSWKLIDGYWYYFGNNGAAYTGVQTVNGTTYYFYRDGSLFDGDGNGSSHSIFIDEGTMQILKVNREGVVTSKQNFSYDQFFTFNGSTYYVSESGVLSGEITINGYDYYLERYRVLTNKTVYSYDQLGHRIVCHAYGNDGRMIKNDWYQDLNDTEKLWYYFDANGKVTTGWKKISGIWYYFYQNGSMAFGTVIELDDGKAYQFSNSGALIQTIDQTVNGWKNVGNGDWMYYQNGKKYSGWLYSGGVWYYMCEGVMIRDDLYTIDEYTENEKSYIFDSNGKMLAGPRWIYYDQYDSGDYLWYYINTDGSLVDGWKQINGVWYFFSDTVMFTGRCGIYNETTEVMEYHLFSSSGAWLGEISKPNNGWRLISNNTWEYYENGSKVYNAWRFISGRWYYFNSNGYAICDYYYKIDGKIYVFDKNCMLLNKAGWYLSSTYSYRNLWFYVNSAGEAYTGWHKINGDWYYMDLNNGYAYADELGYIEGEWYIFDNNCKLVTNRWYETSSGTWYYADANGKLYTGWHLINGDWYYFRSVGGQMATGYTYVSEDGCYYLFANSGRLISSIDLTYDGWRQIDNDWLYVKNGEILTYGWFKSGNNYYYFGDDGYMSKNKTIVNYYRYSYDDDVTTILANIFALYLKSDGTLARNQYIYIFDEYRSYADSEGLALYYIDYAFDPY